MNTRVKLGIFWGAIVVFIIGGINFFGHLLGGHRHFEGGPKGFRSEKMMANEAVLDRMRI